MYQGPESNLQETLAAYSEFVEGLLLFPRPGGNKVYVATVLFQSQSQVVDLEGSDYGDFFVTHLAWSIAKTRAIWHSPMVEGTMQ